MVTLLQLAQYMYMKLYPHPFHFSKEIATKMMNLPLYEDMCPNLIHTFNNSLVYNSVSSSSKDLYTKLEENKSWQSKVSFIMFARLGVHFHVSWIFSERLSRVSLILLSCIFHMKSKFWNFKWLRSLPWFVRWMLNTTERPLQVLFKMFSKEILDEAFSFTSYNTEYYDLILKLAGHYPHSTVLHLVDEDPTTAKSQYGSARKVNLSNLVIGSLKLDHMFASKLVQSPDFFRYQFIGMHYEGIFNFQFIKYNDIQLPHSFICDEL